MNDEHLEEFMSTFIFLQRFDCIAAIDAMFKKMIKEDWNQESLETNKMLILCFLRINTTFKSKITHYKEFRDKSVKYLIDNNIDPKKLLHGII